MCDDAPKPASLCGTGPTGNRREAIILRVPDYVIRHREGWPDEVVADEYIEQDGDFVFIRDGDEVFRVHGADVVSVGPRGDELSGSH